MGHVQTETGDLCTLWPTGPPPLHGVRVRLDRLACNVTSQKPTQSRPNTPPTRLALRSGTAAAALCLAQRARAAATAGGACSPDSIARAGCQYYRFCMGVAWGHGGYVGILMVGLQ